jgi:processing peptidase subunit beta
VTVFQGDTLDNNLRVLTADLPHAQSVAVLVMLAAGSRYETDDALGIAHFSEHMFF